MVVNAARSPQVRAAAFWIGCLTAAALVIFASRFAVSGVGAIGPASRTMVWLLALSCTLIFGLAIAVALRVRRIAREARQRPESGGRLHLRFVLLFTAAAGMPAFMVAILFGLTLSQGLDLWLNQVVRTVVEEAASVGRSYLEYESERVSNDILDIALALDTEEAQAGLAEDPAGYSSFLARQAQARQLAAVRVVGRRGVLAQGAVEGFTPPPMPSASDLGDAEAHPLLLKQEAEYISALRKLSLYDGAYLQIFRPYVAKLTTFSEATEDYRQTQNRRRRIQSVFWLAYLSTTALVLVGATWIGLGGASRIAAPIGRLADAARRVASGDLGARVSVSGDQDEIDALARAFNGMTAQLESQHGDLVKAREEAEQRSRFTRAVLSGVSAGVLGLDRDERITAANRSAAALLGLPEAALEGRRLIDVAPELSEQVSARSFQTEDEPFGLTLHRADGIIHLSVRVAREAGGAGLVITFDDMTKLVAAQRVEAWKDVARRIAHEIKNPLTPIQLSAERLRRRFGKEIADQETFERCTQTILRQVADIGRMVDEFSALARMPAPRLAEEDVLDVLCSAAYGQAITFEDIEFPVHARGEGPFVLFCDGRLLAQAYTNLIKNAAEAIVGRRAGHGDPKQGLVATEVRVEPDQMVIEIADNGPGFPVQNREKLVEPYVTTRAKGTGLGLAIVRRIVEDHGGVLELADSPQGGALVRILLPRRSAPRDPSTVQEEANVV